MTPETRELMRIYEAADIRTRRIIQRVVAAMVAAHRAGKILDFDALIVTLEAAERV